MPSRSNSAQSSPAWRVSSQSPSSTTGGAFYHALPRPSQGMSKRNLYILTKDLCTQIYFLASVLPLTGHYGGRRDLSAMKAAPAKRQIAAAAGSGSPEKIQRSMRSSNTVIVEIHSISLEPGCFTQEPTTFLSLDFYAHDTQNTYPATGLDVELGWSCEFVVEVDEVLVSYLEREPMRLELMERVSQSVPFRRIAAAALDLKPLLDDAAMGRRRCELTKDGSGGGRVGKVDVSIRLGQPLGPAVQALREPRSSAKASSKSAAMRQPIPPFLSMEKPPYKLKLTVVRAEKLR